MKQSNYIVIAVLSILVSAGVFYGGMKYQQGKQPSRTDFQSSTGMRQQDLPAGVQQRMGAGTVRGEIISQDESNIIIKLSDGSSKIVLISENTEINKATEASVDDLGTGKQVMVFGQTNSDGSVSATQIQLNFRLGRDI